MRRKVSMEYIYAVLLLHSAGAEITEEKVSAVLEAAGIQVDKGRVKVLISALDGVNIDEAISQAQPAFAAAPAVQAAQAVPAAPAEAPAEAPAKAPAAEAKKEEKKEEEEEEKKEEEGMAGLAALFG